MRPGKLQRRVHLRQPGKQIAIDRHGPSPPSCCPLLVGLINQSWQIITRQIPQSEQIPHVFFMVPRTRQHVYYSLSITVSIRFKVSGSGLGLACVFADAAVTKNSESQTKSTSCHRRDSRQLIE